MARALFGTRCPSSTTYRPMRRHAAAQGVHVDWAAPRVACAQARGRSLPSESVPWRGRRRRRRVGFGASPAGLRCAGCGRDCGRFQPRVRELLSPAPPKVETQAELPAPTPIADAEGRTCRRHPHRRRRRSRHRRLRQRRTQTRPAQRRRRPAPARSAQKALIDQAQRARQLPRREADVRARRRSLARPPVRWPARRASPARAPRGRICENSERLT